MKSIVNYIIEKSEEENKIDFRKDIIFTIWESPGKKITELERNNKYQKIEYKFIDYKKNLYIDFLLGYKNDSWQLWIGRIGGCYYSDTPYKDLKTNNFKQAIILAVDEINDFLNDACDHPYDYIQYYKFTEEPKKDSE